jgi:hypothetical protein
MRALHGHGLTGVNNGQMWLKSQPVRHAGLCSILEQVLLGCPSGVKGQIHRPKHSGIQRNVGVVSATFRLAEGVVIHEKSAIPPAAGVHNEGVQDWTACIPGQLVTMVARFWVPSPTCCRCLGHHISTPPEHPAPIERLVEGQTW